MGYDADSAVAGDAACASAAHRQPLEHDLVAYESVPFASCPSSLLVIVHYSFGAAAVAVGLAVGPIVRLAFVGHQLVQAAAFGLLSSKCCGHTFASLEPSSAVHGQLIASG